jgi:hypothetical protein
VLHLSVPRCSVPRFSVAIRDRIPLCVANSQRIPLAVRQRISLAMS